MRNAKAGRKVLGVMQREQKRIADLLAYVEELETDRKRFLGLSARLTKILGTPTYEVRECGGYRKVVRLAHPDSRVLSAFRIHLPEHAPKLYEEFLRRIDEMGS